MTACQEQALFKWHVAVCLMRRADTGKWQSFLLLGGSFCWEDKRLGQALYKVLRKQYGEALKSQEIIFVNYCPLVAKRGDIQETRFTGSLGIPSAGSSPRE